MDHEKALRIVNYVKRTFEEEAKNINAKIEFEYVENIHAYRINEDDKVVLRYIEAIKELGFDMPELINTF